MSEVRLLESLRWSPQGGYFLLEAHLARLERAARWWCERANHGNTESAEFSLGERAGGEFGTKKDTNHEQEQTIKKFMSDQFIYVI